MATGSSNMTTYKASQVIGNDSAQNLTGALLQSGASAERNTWIFANTYSGIDGIKHVYDANTNKFKVINNSTDQFWVDVDNGDVYVAGKLGIGYDPNTSGNTYKLYVNGLSYFNNSAYFYDKIGIGYDPEIQGNTYKLYVNDSAYFNIGTSDNTSDLKFVINGNSRYLALGGGGIQARTSADAVTTLYLNFNGGQTYVGGSSYLVGNVGIGYDPDTNGNTYKLYVNGTSYFNGNMTSIGDIYIKKSSSHLYLVNTQWTKGTTPSTQTWSAVEFLSNDASNSRIALLETTLDTSGNSQFNIFLVPNVADSTGWSGIVLKKTSAGVLTVSIAGTTTVTGDIIANSGYLKSTLNGNTVTIGSANASWCHIENSANIPFYFNKSIGLAQGSTIGFAGNQYRPFQIYLGRHATTAGNALNTNNPLIEFSNSDRSQYCQLMYDDHDSLVAPDSLTLVGNQNGIFFICKNGPIWIQGGSNAGGNVNRLTTTSGMPGNMQYNTSRRGTQIYSNGIAFCDPYNGNSNSDAGWIRQQETSGNAGELEIAVGDDGDETIVVRQYNTSNGIKRTLTLLSKDGYTFIPSYLNIGGHEKNASSPTYVWGSNSSDSYLRSYQTSKLSVATSASCTGNANTANYQNCVSTNEIRYARNGNMASANDLWQGWAFAEGKVAVINSWKFGNGNGGLAPIYGSKVYNAVWNDFAEYRESDETESGRVLVSDGSGKLIRATERLQPAARVISDTFGCSVGMSNKAKTPIGVAGRVLVHPYQNRYNYKVGDAVCAAPDGTADIMTREEIIQYPDRIIGIVDEIPEYEVWQSEYTNTKNCDGTGELGETNTTDVPVNGRIWIYVK